MWTWLARGALALLLLAPTGIGQITNQMFVFGNDGMTGAEVMLRFDRDLSLLDEIPLVSGGANGASGMATDGLGRAWLTFDPLNPTQLLRVDNHGKLLPSVVLGHNPVAVAGSADGRIYALTRIPLLSPGPMYAVDADGTILWANPDGPALYTTIFPRRVAVTTTGQLWIGDAEPEDAFWREPLMARIDPDSGDVMSTLEFPVVPPPVGDSAMMQLEGAPDGSLWASVFYNNGSGNALVHIVGGQITRTIRIGLAGSTSATWQLYVDGQGRLYTVGPDGLPPAPYDHQIVRWNPQAAAVPEATYNMGGILRGFALGATGEEIFAVVAPFDAPQTRRFERMNVISGVKSSVPLHPTWINNDIGQGDPTGFIYANVVDRAGDNDGDGASNGAETAAGSNPFDAASRPEGPKVYLSFDADNAIVLTYVDPDGLLDPIGGLDTTTLSLQADGLGEVFFILLPFLSDVQLAPDGTSATATFGGFPLPLGLKIGLQATVADRSGATGWDWQVTPPGDL